MFPFFLPFNGKCVHSVCLSFGVHSIRQARSVVFNRCPLGVHPGPRNFSMERSSLMSLRPRPFYRGRNRDRIYGKRRPAHCFHIHTRRASRTARLRDPIRQWGRPGSYDPNLSRESSKTVPGEGANSSQVQAGKGFRFIFKICERKICFVLAGRNTSILLVLLR